MVQKCLILKKKEKKKKLREQSVFSTHLSSLPHYNLPCQLNVQTECAAIDKTEESLEVSEPTPLEFPPGVYSKTSRAQTRQKIHSCLVTESPWSDSMDCLVSSKALSTGAERVDISSSAPVRLILLASSTDRLILCDDEAMRFHLVRQKSGQRGRQFSIVCVY